MAGQNKVLNIILNLTKKGKGDKEAVKGLKALDDQIGKVQSALTGLAIVGAAKASFEFAELGAQSMRTKTAFENISGGAEAAAANLAAMQRATRGAVSETQMMATANKMMQMGLVNNAAELENVAGMAVKLGAAMGKDATGAMEEFAIMLANQSIPRLDTFGISSGKVRARILELQKETKGLSREQAFMQAVMEEGTEAMGRLGDESEDAALAFERVRAQLEDQKIALAEQVTPAWVWFLDKINRGIESFKQLVVMVEIANGKLNGLSDAEIQAHVEARLLAWNLGDTATAAGDVATAAPIAAQGIEEASAAAKEATGYFGGLASNARELGNAFTSGVPDAEDMWSQMLETGRAAGMSAEELGAAAESMGVADAAAVQGQLSMYQLVQAWGEGILTASDMQAAASKLDAATRFMAEAEELDAEGKHEAAEAARQKAQALLDDVSAMADATVQLKRTREMTTPLTGAMDGLAGSARGTADGFRDATSALRAFREEAAKGIPSAPSYTAPSPGSTPGGGRSRGKQFGGSILAGETELVGETGPEFVTGPARVTSTRETRNILNRNRTTNVYVSDRASASALSALVGGEEMDYFAEWF